MGDVDVYEGHGNIADESATTNNSCFSNPPPAAPPFSKGDIFTEY
jgi:hypothetical protein